MHLLIILFVTKILEINTPKSAESNSCHLFKISRNRDTKEIFYDVKLLENEKLSDNPVEVYWWDKSAKNPLSCIQEKFAYGLNFLLKSEEYAVFKFVSYDKMTFYLKKSEMGVYQVFTKINEMEIALKSIYVEFENDSFWFPAIEKISLQGENMNNQKIYHIVKP